MTHETSQVSDGALSALLNSVMGHDLCEMGEALVNQNGLEWHVDYVCKVLTQTRENGKTDKRPEALEGKCGSIYAELEFPGRKRTESRMLC